MNEQTLRFRVGVFVLAALLLLAVLITLFGGMPRLFTRTDQFEITFEDAAGIATGTPVRRSGVRVGEVSDVHLDNETGKVVVEIRVDRKYKLRNNDQPVLIQGLLGGDTTIDFMPRKDAERGDFAESGERYVGVKQNSLQNVVDATTDVMPDAEAALKAIQKSLDRFEKMAPTIEEAIKEYGELAKEVRQAVPELRKTNEELLVTTRNWGRLGERLDVFVRTNQEKVTKAIENFNDAIVRISDVFNAENQKNIQATLKNLQAGTANLESLTSNTDSFVKEGRETLKRVTESVREANEVFQTLQKATKPLADRSDAIMRNLDDGTAQVSKLAAEMRELLRCVAREDGTIQALLTDPSLYRNLNAASCMLTRIFPRLERILQNVEVFADKIARHPEKLGVRGAVAPSSGLK